MRPVSDHPIRRYGPRMIYYEDLEVGAETNFGSYEVTRDEVLEFARKYDPQPFHLSEEEAAKTHFGRLAASGWHTAAMTMAVIARHVVEHRQALRDPHDDLPSLKSELLASSRDSRAVVPPSE